VTLVEQREIVDEAVRDRNAARRERTRPVHEQRDEDLLALGGHGRRRQRGTGGDEHGQQGDCTHAQSHSCPPCQGRNGHSRNFSLVICHNRASPCGSTIRKKMIKPPNTISSICFWSATRIG